MKVILPVAALIASTLAATAQEGDSGLLSPDFMFNSTYNNSSIANLANHCGLTIAPVYAIAMQVTQKWAREELSSLEYNDAIRKGKHRVVQWVIEYGETDTCDLMPTVLELALDVGIYE